MRTGILCALAVFLASVTGCAGFLTAPVVPPSGWVYSDFKAPLDVDYNETELGGKKGTAKTMSILGAVSTGDASIETAAKGMKKVNHVDYHLFNVLGVYSEFTITAHGE